MMTLSFFPYLLLVGREGNFAVSWGNWPWWLVSKNIERSHRDSNVPNGSIWALCAGKLPSKCQRSIHITIHYYSKSRIKMLYSYIFTFPFRKYVSGFQISSSIFIDKLIWENEASNANRGSFHSFLVVENSIFKYSYQLYIINYLIIVVIWKPCRK